MYFEKGKSSNCRNYEQKKTRIKQASASKRC